MIIYWIQCLVRNLRWLLNAPLPLNVARINPNAQCPCCGARKGKLLAVAMQKTTRTGMPEIIVTCQHTCELCGARWFEQPVAKIEGNQVHPALAPAGPPPVVRMAATR